MRKKNRIAILLLFLFYTGHYFIYAQRNAVYCQTISNKQTSFYHLKLAEGMAQNSITSINQGSDGQMWFATKEGLVRYDANNMHYYNYQPKDTCSIGGNFVERVYIAHDGAVWVGTQPAVLSKFNPETETFTRVKGINGKRIKGISQDKNHLFWITTNDKLYSYNDKAKTLHSFSYNNIGLDRLLITQSGRIFVTTNERYILEFFPETKTFVKIEILQSGEMHWFRSTTTYSLFHITEDYLGNIWLTTSMGFIVKLDAHTNKQTRYYFTKDYENNADKYLTLMFIFEDNNHMLWFGTWFDGLYRFNPKKNIFSHYMPDEQNTNLISNSIVHSGFQDKAGDLWFGTEFAGINILKKSNKFSIEAYDKNAIYPLPAVKFSFVVKDKNARKWVGTMRNGLYYSDKETPNEYHKYKNLPINYWASTAWVDLSENVWFGIERNLIKYNPDTQKIIIYKHNPDNYNSLPKGRINCIYQDKDSIFWIGTSGGLARFNEKKNIFNRFCYEKTNPKSISSNYITGIVSDSNHDIWVGTNFGLNKLNKQTGNFMTFKHSYDNRNTISSNYINDLLFVKNRIWIATSGGGLVSYNIKKKIFEIYDEKSGFQDNIVKGIEVDNHNNLWITTKHNIVKLDLTTNQFINYDATDGLYKKIYIKNVGLQNLEFDSGFSNKDADGNIYFGGMSGIMTFHPDSLPINHYKPPVIIEYFGVNGVKKKWQKSTINLKTNENNLKFVLSTLNYIQPDKNQYAYKLLGLDSTWHYAGHNNIALYDNIPPGEYIFKYKGANNDGVWGAVYSTVPIVIDAPYYKSSEFYIIILLFILSFVAVFLAYRYYLYRKIERQKQKLRYNSSNLKESDALRIKEKLEKSVVKDKLFLEPDLSLQKLAKIIDERPHYVSQVINQLYQKRFHEYINTYRIAEAKDMLKNTHLKIEAVAYDAGFNALSTFNMVFKKEVGMTPSKFRKKHKI